MQNSKYALILSKHLEKINQLTTLEENITKKSSVSEEQKVNSETDEEKPSFELTPNFQ